METPYGKFTDLMVIEAKFDNGKFKFYYQKGMGYIGATTKKEGLISYLREYYFFVNVYPTPILNHLPGIITKSVS